MNVKERKALRQVADRFIETVKEEVDNAVMFGDIDRLDRLVTQVKILLDHEVLNALRQKGFNREIRRLCDKAGRKAKA